MVYYNGMLLPEIPDYFSTSYPFVFITEQSNRYNLCFSKAEYYFKSSDATLRPGSDVTNLWLTKTDFETGAIWTYRNQTSYYFGQTEYPIWNSYGMKLNSASSATIVYPKTTPIPKDSMTEFLRVEYLKSSGYQYFDTGIIPNATTEVEIKYSIQVFSKYGPHVLSNSQWHCPFPRDDQSKFLGYRMGNQQLIELDPSLNTDYIVKAYPSGKVIINDVEYPGVEAGTATSTIPLHMFTYGSSSPGSTDYTSSTRVYYCKIWQDGELVRDFVPIFSTDGRCGMLDLVNNVIYYSMTCYGFLECQNLVLNDEEKDYPYEIKIGTLVKIANAVRTKMKSMQFMSPEEMVKNILNL